MDAITPTALINTKHETAAPNAILSGDIKTSLGAEWNSRILSKKVPNKPLH